MLQEKLRGVNLGNWLVLEKWMDLELFGGTTAEDETDLAEMLPHDELSDRLKVHRDTYITLADFRYLASLGLNTIRIPVPFFIFDDYAPYIGCIEYLDKAFDWAKQTGLKILIDLHTAPESQNGFDNGGICGVCKWHLDEGRVQFVVDVLERLAIRYKDDPALYGIQFLNEPISPEFFTQLQKTGRYPPRDPKRAEGSCGVPTDFLYKFYTDTYGVLRRHLDDDKAIVFHDGFRLDAWKDLMRGPEYKNLVLDTHQYISMMPPFDPENPPSPEEIQELMKRKPTLKEYFAAAQRSIDSVQEMRKFFPVIIGEWSVAHRPGKMGETTLEEHSAITAMANIQLKNWETTDGWFFWSYKLFSEAPGWDFRQMILRGYFPSKFN
ncbi:MAG: glycoside hydrolase family 5 protein [Christensenellales bacterium]|jgi:glucan 1,3-beta-glucosidase